MKTRSQLFGKIAKWGFRVVYISVILAMCDFWSASTARRDTVFSKCEFRITDGGSAEYAGFGYTMAYLRKMDGSAYGPVLHFWFTPFLIDWACLEKTDSKNESFC